jgi:outer membrane protein OmpA-like peptidoglycan-associated protein
MSNVPANTVNESSFLNQPEDNAQEAKGMGWLLPLLLLVLGAGLVLYFTKSSSTSPLPVAEQFIVAFDTAASKKASTKFDSSQRSFTIKLPDDSEIVASGNGMEFHLVEYLNNSKDTINKNRWFNFDRIFFEENNTTLTTPSLHQVQNIVSILSAYPKMKIKIGAFTDKTNDEAADLKLTAQQANEVEAALKKAGANPTQIVSAEGYGSQYAKASSTASPEERMKDRKISINVTEK